MGCNAIRFSHNPPASEYLDLCDQMGFLVIDEAFDMWQKERTNMIIISTLKNGIKILKQWFCVTQSSFCYYVEYWK
jgi:beta-galactosidase/beta-glucuronidase